VATGATSSTSPDSVLPFFGSSTSVPDTLSSVDPVSTATTLSTGTTVAGTGGPAGTATSTVPGGATGPGVLEPSLTTLVLPRTDATVGVSRATLKLRNAGAAAITYTTQSSSPGLTVSPPQGGLAPGATTDLTVTLDATRVPSEGPFAGTLTFSGTGGTKTVAVQSVVGRPPEIFEAGGEACTPPSQTCSPQIKLAISDPTRSPCNTQWIYIIGIRDMSAIQSARVIARKNGSNADSPLRKGGATDLFTSDAFGALGSGVVLRFYVEAVDQYGFGRRLADQTITCPSPAP